MMLVAGSVSLTLDKRYDIQAGGERARANQRNKTEGAVGPHHAKSITEEATIAIAQGHIAYKRQHKPTTKKAHNNNHNTYTQLDGATMDYRRRLDI